MRRVHAAFLLRTHERIVHTLLLHQRRVRTLLNNHGGTARAVTAFAKDNDAVRRAHRRQTMCDDEGCPFETVRLFLSNGTLDDPFALRVERRRCFVEDEDGGVREQPAGNGDALLLPPGELAPARPNDSFVILRKALDKVVGVGSHGCALHLLARNLFGRWASCRDVFVDAGVEQEGLLRHYANAAPQLVQIELSHVHSVDEHTA
mmetsp:Transcript_20413/g.66288  ORF Transcript_20413/g.66288 Transcript_20413/m.66288 type:complete len:205 (+) Transcript_20413:2097-2711(+)